MKRLPFIAILLAAVLLVAADKKDAPSPVQIQQWIKQLGDGNYKVREQATGNLIKAGKVAIDAVNMASKSKDAEVKKRALRIIKHPEKVAEKKAIEARRNALAFFKKLGEDVVMLDETSPGKPVIELDLQFTQVTKAGGLVHLNEQVRLKEVELTGTIIYDVSKPYLTGIPKGGPWLRIGITDTGLVRVKVFSQLQKLNLGESKITDAGLVHLKGLTKLRELHLDFTKVTDAGLAHLKGLPSLRILWVQGTNLTLTKVEKIEKELPNCKIYWNDL